MRYTGAGRFFFSSPLPETIELNTKLTTFLKKHTLMKTNTFITMAAAVLTLGSGLAAGEATPVEGQEFINDSSEYDFGYFTDVHFMNVPDYDAQLNNLVDSSYDFSIVFNIEDVKMVFSKTDGPVSPDGPGSPSGSTSTSVYFFSDQMDAEGIRLKISLEKVDNEWKWALQNKGSEMVYGANAGKIINEQYCITDATYVLRCGKDFIDFWRVVDELAEEMVSLDEPLNVEGWNNGVDDRALRFGDEQFQSYLTKSNINSATLYNGLYDANGLIPQPGDGNVPEPTTATLSLLALGALAMRRRRR